jgi:hypothetical protein
MADATYGPKVYRDSGGNRLTISPGGNLVIEGVVSGPSNAGQNFFVSSTAGSSGNDGLGFSTPKATLAQALALCTANRGDRIFLMPAHAESVGAAGLAWNVAGVSIIGLGNGSNRPTFTWHTTDAVVTISAANVLIQNIITAVDVDEIVSMFLVTGANVTFDAVDFVELATSAQAIQWLLTTNAADFLTIKNCRHRQITAAAAAQLWIQIVGADFPRIVDNTFMIVAAASTGSSLISFSTACIYVEVMRNVMMWIGATITKVVTAATGTTGYFGDNRLASGTSVATAAAIACDAAFMGENYWGDTAQVSGLLAPVVDTDT